MRSRRIALAVNTSWNVYNFRRGLLDALKAEGYDIVVIAPRDAYSKRLERSGYRYLPITMDNKGTNPLEELKLIRRFYRTYREAAPDLVLQYTIKPNIYGSIAAGILGIPTICNISGLGTVFLDDRISSKIARFLYRIALRFPKRVFFQNRDDRDLFVRKKLVHIRKTDLIPGSGIDTVRFAPRPPRAPDGRVRFLLIARLVRDKGLIEYIEAAHVLRQRYGKRVECALLGAFYPGNPTAVRPEEIAAWEEEGRIRYLGESDDVASVMAAYDCVVLPSYREGLSRVLLEAAAMAKPIVTTDVPGCRDVVVEGENGFLCRPGDAGALAEAMEKIVQMSERQRREMGRAGRQKVVDEFEEGIVIDRYRAAVREILGS